MKIKQEKIKKFISDILVGLKIKKIDANLISSHLVKSDMCGHYSHGIRRIVQYIDSIKAGNIKINNKPTIVKKEWDVFAGQKKKTRKVWDLFKRSG